MNLSELIINLNLHKGISDVHKTTNELINDEILGNVKQEVLPLLMNNDLQSAIKTDAFKQSLIILLFEGKKIKQLTNAYIDEIAFAVHIDLLDKMKIELQGIIKDEMTAYSKKAHKPMVQSLINEKEQLAKELVSKRQTA